MDDEAPDTGPRLLYSIKEFCKMCGFSRSFLYKLISQGIGPEILKIGNRSMITPENAKMWLLRFAAKV